MLSKEQLRQLRKEIVLNSVFTADYENSFDIDANDVAIFFEGYFEELCEIVREEIGDEEYSDLIFKNNGNFYDEIFKRDTIDNLWNYYSSIEDPLF